MNALMIAALLTAAPQAPQDTPAAQPPAAAQPSQAPAGASAVPGTNAAPAAGSIPITLDEARAEGLRTTGKINDFGCISGEVPNRGIDLSQRNLHMSSLNEESRPHPRLESCELRVVSSEPGRFLVAHRSLLASYCSLTWN